MKSTSAQEYFVHKTNKELGFTCETPPKEFQAVVALWEGLVKELEEETPKIKILGVREEFVRRFKAEVKSSTGIFNSACRDYAIESSCSDGSSLQSSVFFHWTKSLTDRLHVGLVLEFRRYPDYDTVLINSTPTSEAPTPSDPVET
jgi:hypothetical protein